MPAGASEDFLFCVVEIDSLLLLLLMRDGVKHKYMYLQWYA